MSNKDWAEVAAEAVCGKVIANDSKCEDIAKMASQVIVFATADAIRTALAGYAVVEQERYTGLLNACLRYRVGEHDMVECKICGHIGHNDVLGDMYGIKHQDDCAYLLAAPPSPRGEGKADGNR